MAAPDVDLEIHAPGLDLHHERWNYHVMFMDEVHENMQRIAAQAWDFYEKQGRGAVFVDQDQWMSVIRNNWEKEGQSFPCHYVRHGDSIAGVDFGILREGFIEMVREYNPETHLVLTVQHHSSDLLSAYLLKADPETAFRSRQPGS